MSGRARSLSLLAAVTALLGLHAGTAWAPHVAQLQVTPAQVKPGDTVTVFGPRGYGHRPVEIRFDSLTGPVLGSFQPDQQLFAQWGPGTVIIPTDAKPGIHVLYASQELPDSDAHIRGVPARAVIEVTEPGASPMRNTPGLTHVAGRPASLETSDGVSWVLVALVAVGVAGLGLCVAVAAAAGLRSRDEGEPSAEPVKR